MDMYPTASSARRWSNLHKLIVGLPVGAVCGSLAGAILLGGMAWLNEAQSGIEEQQQWATVAALIGIKLGFILGGFFGVVVALVRINGQRSA